MSSKDWANINLLLCAYGDVECEVMTVDVDSITEKDEKVLPYVLLTTQTREEPEQLLAARYSSKILPSNQVAARRIAKHLYLLGDNGSESSMIDYILGLCNVDLTMVMCGYMYSSPSPLPGYRKSRMQNALANIESNLKMDGRLFEDKLTIAEFAIFEIQFWLSLVFGRSVFRDYPKIMETVNLIKSETSGRMKTFMEDDMEVLEYNGKQEIDAMVKLMHIRYPEKKPVKQNDSLDTKRNSVLNAFYAHMGPAVN